MASMHKAVMRARLPFSHQSTCQDQVEALKSGAMQKLKSPIIGRGQDLQASRSSVDDQFATISLILSQLGDNPEVFAGLLGR